MKYAIFFSVLLLGVPLLAAASAWRDRVRNWVFTAMVASTALGDVGGINFLSFEGYRGPDRGFEVTLTDLLAMALAAALILRRPGRISWLPFNTFWMLLYFLLAVVSVFDVSQPTLAGFTLFKLVRAYGIYWVTVNAIRAGVSLRAFWWAILGIAFYLAWLAMKQKYLGGVYRVPTAFDHPNTVALYLNQILPVLLAFGLARKGLSVRWALVSLFGALAMLFTVVMTFSRAGMVLSGLAVLGVLLYANRRAVSARVRIASVVVVLGLVLGGAMVGKSVVRRFMEAPEASHLARAEFNRAAIMMARDNPMGVGINQFSQVLSTTPRYHSHVMVMANEEQSGVAHHVYLLNAAELGWFGLFVFVVIIGRFMWPPFRMAIVRGDLEGLLPMGLLAGALALHLSGLLEWVFMITPVFFLYLICCGVAVGLADLHRLEKASVRRRNRVIPESADTRSLEAA